MVIQRAHWVQQQAMKESGALIRIDLDLRMPSTQQDTPASGQSSEV